jgi:integrase
MAREDSPYIVGDFWLDKRRDGKSPEIWQIAHYEPGTRQVRYSSTRQRSFAAARASIPAHFSEARSKQKQPASEAKIIPLLFTYWKEHGSKAVAPDQIASSIRCFMGFLFQDEAGINAVVDDLTPAMVERFREWRMAPHEYTVPWGGKEYAHSSKGVKGESVQRNLDDVRAGVNHADNNRRLDHAPKVPSVAKRYRSEPRDRVLTMQELGAIVWYTSHFPDLARYVALMLGTAVRPEAAAVFDAQRQYGGGRLVDLHPADWERTDKRNGIVPAIRPLRLILRRWQADSSHEASLSHGKAWRTMRRVLGLSDDVVSKTIRHTVATLLYQDLSVPERQISDLLGHIVSGGMRRTTRVYAKYDPLYMAETERALATIWHQVRREARQFGAVHLLSKPKRGSARQLVKSIPMQPALPDQDF